MSAIHERGDLLHRQAVGMIYAAHQMDRRPSRWRINNEAETDLRCARDDQGLYIYAPAAAGTPGLLGFPVEIDRAASSIALELDNGDRILPGGDLGPESVTIERNTLRRRGYDPRF